MLSNIPTLPYCSPSSNHKTKTTSRNKQHNNHTQIQTGTKLDFAKNSLSPKRYLRQTKGVMTPKIKLSQI